MAAADTQDALQTGQEVGKDLLTCFTETERAKAQDGDFGLPISITEVPKQDFTFDYRTLQEAGQFMLCLE